MAGLMRRSAVAVAIGLTWAAVAPSSAAPASCPNAATTTFASYTQTRGCMVSFDATPIVYNLYEPLHPAPHSLYTIMEGPGWGIPAPPVDPALIQAGFAELTWDPRGFGQSGGVAEVDLPGVDGRDVSTLIDKILTGRRELVVDQCAPKAANSSPERGSAHNQRRQRVAAAQPHYVNDHAAASSCGQPVVGMVGGSYGGGISINTAAYDRRVKAIVPGATWNSLPYSLDPNGVPKQGALFGLYAIGMSMGTASHLQPDAGTGDSEPTRYDPMIHQALVQTAAQGYVDPSVVSWFGQRSLAVFGTGPAPAVPDVPTLLMQGTEDVLFDMNNAWANDVEISHAHPGLPVKLLMLCAGHTACPHYDDTSSSASPIWPRTSVNDVVERQEIAWFEHYLRGQGANDGVPAPVVYQAQDGNYYPVATLPTVADPGAAVLATAPLAGMVISPGIPSAPPPDAGQGTQEAFNALTIDSPTPAGSPLQVTVPVVRAPADETLPVVGIGHVDVTATVQGPVAELFFRLIDHKTGALVDSLTQPVRLDSSAGAQHLSIDLEGVAYDLPPGDTLDLQVSTASTSFMLPRTPALVTLTDGTVRVPTYRPHPVLRAGT